MDAVVGVLIEYALKPILHQLEYLFFYKRNVEEVKKKLDTLRDTKSNVQIFVSQSKGQGHDTRKNVQRWLDNVKEELDMAQQNEGGSSSSHPSCFNCIQRYQLSREAKKRMENIVELINEGKQFNEDNVGHRVASSEITSTTLPEDYQIIESRSSMAREIMDALVDPSVNKVGICGMGGVGKSVLLKEVRKLVIESKLFDRVIPPVEVGKSKNIFQIQEEIRSWLNIELNKQFEMERASMLRTQIVEMKENILFMLDDLWKEYDVEDKIGIPIRSKGCKIVMTSQRRDILENQMNTEKLFEMELLGDEESWKFFVAIVGELVENDIQQTARDVVKRCGGLPLALKILAKPLKGKRVKLWKEALYRLKNPYVVDSLGVTNKLYACLKLNYDSLIDEAKSVFLLCSVFPDDYRINVTDLQMYVMGMGFLNDRKTYWRHAKNRVIKLVDDLKSSYLLLAPDEEKEDHYVQMHDAVRDLAKYIASEVERMPSLTYGSGQREWEEDERYGCYNAIYVDCTTFLNLPPKLEFPSLQLLLILNNNRSTVQIPDSFFEGMEKLRVLDMRDICFEPTKTFHSLKNLQTLCLSSCKCNDIDTIGELKKLKILKIHGDYGMEELPKSMSNLTELKVLHVINCRELKVVHPNIISNMTKLEELKLGWNPKFGWGEKVEFENRSVKNVKLSELINSLTRLSTLWTEIGNVEILRNELSLERAEELEEFLIIAGSHDFKPDYSWFSKNTEKCLMLDIKSPIAIDGALEKLLQKCEQCEVKDSVGFAKLLCNPNQNYAYPRLKGLNICIHGNSDMPRPNGNFTPFFNLQVSFPKLEDLGIEGENNSETLWHRNNGGLTENLFCKLQKIRIKGCNKLRYVFPLHMVASLVSLKQVQVVNCELVERIFEIEEQWWIDDVKVVSWLRLLVLHNLPNLKQVWRSNVPAGVFLTFPNLEEVRIWNCPQLKTLFPASFTNNNRNHDRQSSSGAELKSSYLDNIPKLTEMNISCFGSLKSIQVRRCENLECLVPSWSSTFWILTHLLSDSNLLNSSVESIIFNKLEELKLVDLPRLVSFYSGKCMLSFPCLTKFEISGCSEMETFSYGIVTTPKLQHININKRDIPVSPQHGLNSIIQTPVENGQQGEQGR